METGKGIRGDGVRLFSQGKWRRRQDSSTVLEVDDIAKSGAAAREVEGGGLHLEVKNDQRKLGR
jgi:hypothetical protein